MASALQQELYVPSGIYDIYDSTGTVVPLVLSVKSNTKLTLDPGAEIVMTASPTINANIFLLWGATNVVITGGMLTGDRTQPSQSIAAYGVVIANGSKDVTLRDVIARNCNLDGFYVDNAERVTFENCIAVNNRRTGMSLVKGSNLRVTGCRFLSNGLANGTFNGFELRSGAVVEPNSGNSISDITFDGCTFANNAKRGLYVSKGFGLGIERVRVRGCSFIGNGLMGVTFRWVTECKIEGSVAHGNINSGIEMHYTTNTIVSAVKSTSNLYGLSITACQAIIVADSIISDNLTTGLFLGTDAYIHCTLAQITGNRIEHNGHSTYGGSGVHVSDGTGGVISANVITGNRQNGIILAGTDFLVTGNQIVANGTDGTLEYTTSSGETDTSGIVLRQGAYNPVASRNRIIKNVIRKSLRWDSGRSASITSTSITLAETANRTTDYYVGQTIEIVAGTAAGQTNKITAYNGSTRVATLQNSWGSLPSSDSVYLVRDPAHPKYSIRIKNNVFGTVVEDNDWEAGGLYSDESATSSTITTYFSGRGLGDPNSVIPAVIGSRYYRTDGGPSAVLYIKESGTSPGWNTGWRAIGATFSSMTGATAANTLNNANFGQTWNWSLTSADATGMTFGESSASTGDRTAIVEMKTLSGSKAIPVIAHAGGLGQPVIQTVSDDGTAYTPPQETIYHGRVATTSAALTTIFAIDVPTSTLVAVKARVRGRSAGGSGAFYVIEGAFKRGTTLASPVGSSAVKTFEAEDAPWDADMISSGSQVFVRVTGAAATDITWHATVEVSYLDQ